MKRKIVICFCIFLGFASFTNLAAEEIKVYAPVAQNFLIDEKDYELINGIVDFYILPTVSFIKEKKYTEAVEKYKTMTKSLEDYYGIKNTATMPSNYDYTSGGHGVKKLGEYND